MRGRRSATGSSAPGAALMLPGYDAKEASRSIWPCQITMISAFAQPRSCTWPLCPSSSVGPAYGAWWVGNRRDVHPASLRQRLTIPLGDSSPSSQHAVLASPWAVLPKVCSLGAEVQSSVISRPSWLPVGLFTYFHRQLGSCYSFHLL